MTIEIKVPTLPESVADAEILAWHKKPGDSVNRDDVLVEVETDKVVLEVPAPEAGVIGEIVAGEGTTVLAHQVIGTLSPGAEGAVAAAGQSTSTAQTAPAATGNANAQTSPTVRRMLEEHGLNVADVPGSGPNGRIVPEDVEKHVAANKVETAPVPEDAVSTPGKEPTSIAAIPSEGAPPVAMGSRDEQRVPMSRLRARIAERLLDATQSTAMLTTFNEINMHAFIEMRKRYKDDFEKAHGVRLGFMSIFLKAATEALRRYPDVNASIDGDDIVYHGFCDIGVAVSSDRGLVVPVLRNTENMSLADIEKAIGDFAARARDGKLTIEEMTGGTFTVSNGGVFGSLLSTPILNPPQSAILGMHATQERPVAEDGQVVIRPMMYVALSYDHRIIDGKGAVTFLKTIKEIIENPERLIFEL